MSFETMWTPDLSARTGPRYAAIADALAADVGAGRVTAGERLPTHRELARLLAVTVGTVSRAYAEAQRRGLVSGEVGRGTFVRDDAVAVAAAGTAATALSFGEPLRVDDGLIDLGPAVPASPLHDEEERVLREAFAALGRAADLPSLLGCQPHAGMGRHREVAAAWLSELGLKVPPGRVLITSGAQHAMAVTFAAVARPGDLVLTEDVTFPGMKGLANLMHLRLQGLAMDADGLCPDAFEHAARQGESRVLYTIPTHHNPTATVMPEERRREIVAVARRHGVTIVEDDVYGFLPRERPPSFAALAPELAYSIHGTSKIVVPGLRVGFLAAPEAMVERLAAGIWATTWMASPPMAEIVSRWIADGTLRRFLAWRREEAQARVAIARRVLDGAELSASPRGFFVWLRLPEPWCATDFVNLARRRGVLVIPPETFVAGRGRVPHAVRVSLAAIRERERLEEGLTILAGLLAEPPSPCVFVP